MDEETGRKRGEDVNIGGKREVWKGGVRWRGGVGKDRKVRRDMRKDERRGCEKGNERRKQEVRRRE